MQDTRNSLFISLDAEGEAAVSVGNGAAGQAAHEASADHLETEVLQAMVAAEQRYACEHVQLLALDCSASPLQLCRPVICLGFFGVACLDRWAPSQITLSEMQASSGLPLRPRVPAAQAPLLSRALRDRCQRLPQVNLAYSLVLECCLFGAARPEKSKLNNVLSPSFPAGFQSSRYEGLVIHS